MSTTIPFTLASDFGTAVGSGINSQVNQLLNKAKLHGARVQRKSEQEALATSLGVSYECVRQIQSALYTNPQGLPWNPNAKAGSTCTPAIAEQFGYTFKGNEFDYINGVPVGQEYISGHVTPNAALAANQADVIAAAGGTNSGAAKIKVPNTVKAAQRVGMTAASTASSQQDDAGPLDFLQTPSATPRGPSSTPRGSKTGSPDTSQASIFGGSNSALVIVGLLVGVASLFLAVGQGGRR